MTFGLEVRAGCGHVPPILTNISIRGNATLLYGPSVHLWKENNLEFSMVLCVCGFWLIYYFFFEEKYVIISERLKTLNTIKLKNYLMVTVFNSLLTIKHEAILLTASFAMYFFSFQIFI